VFVKREGPPESSTYFPAPLSEWPMLQRQRELYSEIVVTETAQVLPVAVLRVRWTPPSVV
jgi:hypothetical protein